MQDFSDHVSDSFASKDLAVRSETTWVDVYQNEAKQSHFCCVAVLVIQNS